MALPFDEILTDDATPSSGVVLSERSVSVILKAMELTEKREAWDEMTDAEWDEVFGAISEAQFEVLNESESGGLQLQQAGYGALRTGSNVTWGGAGTTAIEWNSGTFDSSNPTRIPIFVTGYHTVMGNFWANRTVADSWWTSLRKNGSEILCSQFTEGQLNLAPVVAWQFDATEDDYIELIVQRFNTTILQVASFNPRIFVSRLMYT